MREKTQGSWARGYFEIPRRLVGHVGRIIGLIVSPIDLFRLAAFQEDEREFKCLHSDENDSKK